MKIQVDPNYHDRGMMKWQGFILHEMATELSEATEHVTRDIILGDKLDEDFWEESFID